METSIANTREHIEAMQADVEVIRLRRELIRAVAKHRYSYNFSWFGRPIIQLPDDVLALQEIIMRVEPDLVVETGVAHGGSVVFSASLLELLGKGRVIGIDIEIRPQNREALMRHPLRHRFELLEGSSVSASVVDTVHAAAKSYQNVLVILDSDHTHAHVLKELEIYSALVRAGSYVIVMDTIIEDMDADSFPDRSWGRGNNPKTAVWQFLKQTDRFIIDHEVEHRLLVSVAPDGYLRCRKD